MTFFFLHEISTLPTLSGRSGTNLAAKRMKAALTSNHGGPGRESHQQPIHPSNNSFLFLNTLIFLTTSVYKAPHFAQLYDTHCHYICHTVMFKYTHMFLLLLFFLFLFLILCHTLVLQQPFMTLVRCKCIFHPEINKVSLYPTSLFIIKISTMKMKVCAPPPRLRVTLAPVSEFLWPDRLLCMREPPHPQPPQQQRG